MKAFWTALRDEQRPDGTVVRASPRRAAVGIVAVKAISMRRQQVKDVDSSRARDGQDCAGHQVRVIDHGHVPDAGQGFE